MQDNLQHCRQLVRQYDYPRYLLSLTLPRDKRDKLWVLGAFNVEISRASEISEPAVAAIRLKWWLDVLDKPQDHPVVNEINEMDFDLKFLKAAVEAREIEIAQGYMFADMKEMDSYATDTGGFWAAIAVDDVRQQSWLQSLGQVWVLQGLLWSVGYQLSQGKCNLPESVVAAHGIEPLSLEKDSSQELSHIISSLSKRIEETVKRLDIPQDALMSRSLPFIMWRANKMRQNPIQVLAQNPSESNLMMLWKIFISS